jgi:hypothetical protein
MFPVTYELNFYILIKRRKGPVSIILCSLKQMNWLISNGLENAL